MPFIVLVRLRNETQIINWNHRRRGFRFRLKAEMPTYLLTSVGENTLISSMPKIGAAVSRSQFFTTKKAR